MTVRKKTLVITGITLFSLFGSIYTTSKAILLDGLAKIERQNTEQNVRRVV